MKKNIALILAAALVLPTVIAAGGCGANSGVSSSAEATAENPMVLTLAHGLSETHTVHIAMTQFADEVKERRPTDASLSTFSRTDSLVLRQRT